MAVSSRMVASPSRVGDARPIKLGSNSAAATVAMQKYRYARHVDQFTSPEQVDSAMLSVVENAAAWAEVSPASKIEMLKEIKKRLIKSCIQLGRASAVIKGFGSDGDPVVETRANMTGFGLCVVVIPHLDALIRSLEPDASSTTPAVADLPCRITSDGRRVLEVASPEKPPNSSVLRGTSGYVYLQPGCEPSQGVERRAAREAAADGVCLVLGAGNQAPLGLCDSIHAMFLDGHVACLKYHDAQAETAPFLEYVLEPLTAGGFLKTFHCDLDLTRHAIYHDAVCRVHITGSDRTHDAIAWGSGEEAVKRMAAGELLLKVPMTSELGNVTPAIMVPGLWTSEEIQAAAQMVVGSMLDNAGCNCLAPKAIVLSSEWPQADEFEAAFKEALATKPGTPLWYPGSKQLHETFIEQHPGCELIMPPVEPDNSFTYPVVPWAVHSVTVSSAEDAAAVPGLAKEFFAPVATVIRVNTAPGSPSSGGEASTAPADAGVTAAFLRAVPQLLEEGLWGNLTTSVYAPPAVQEAAGAELQSCLDELRYGSVMLNMPSMMGYALSEGGWGGFQYPDTSVAKAGSGVGQVWNVYGIDGMEKQVLTKPWTSSVFNAPTMPRFVMKGMMGYKAGGWTGVLQAYTP